MKLHDEGYDVWLGNNSDTNESVHVGDDWEEDWKNLNWGAYGVKDIPSEIDVVLSVSGADKLTYIGYSQGTAQMFYGLSQLEEAYFASRLERFIALAPGPFCVIWEGYETYEE